MSELTSQPPEDNGPFKGGRPFRFTDPAELRREIQNYFDISDPHIETRVVEGGVNQRGETIWYKREIMTEQKPYTMSGLARSLGVARNTLLNYEDPEHYTEEISPEVRQELMSTVSYAKQRVEEYTEGKLFSPFSNGAKFALINNYKGWADKIVQEHEGGFFNAPHRLEVEIVNPEIPADDETETEPHAEPSAPPAS